MKHISYVCSNPHFNLNHASGYSTHIREFISALKQEDAKVSVFLPQLFNSKKDFPSIEQHAHLPTTSQHRKAQMKDLTPQWLWHSLKDTQRIYQDSRFKRSLVRMLSVAEPDIIYERLDFSGPVALSFAQARHIPYFLEIHAPLPMEGELIGDKHPLSFYFSHLIKKAIQQAHGIVVVSDYLKEWVERIRGNSDGIKVIHNGVNLSVFNPEKINRASASRWVGCQPKPYIGFAGSALAWHGLPMLLNAFSTLVSEKQATLVIVGPAKNDVNIRKHAADLNLDRFITWTGNIAHDAVPEVLFQCDIAVLPNANPYQNPIKLFEYGAMGCAVIAPRTQPIEEILAHEENALLFELGNENELARCIERLIYDDELRLKLGHALQAKILTSSGWQHRAKEFLDFIST